MLHEAEGNTLRLHVLEPPEPTLLSTGVSYPVGEAPAGLVRQTQQPLIPSSLAEGKRWPRLPELARRYGTQPTEGGRAGGSTPPDFAAAPRSRPRRAPAGTARSARTRSRPAGPLRSHRWRACPSC